MFRGHSAICSHQGDADEGCFERQRELVAHCVVCAYEWPVNPMPADRRRPSMSAWLRLRAQAARRSACMTRLPASSKPRAQQGAGTDTNPYCTAIRVSSQTRRSPRLFSLRHWHKHPGLDRPPARAGRRKEELIVHPTIAPSACMTYLLASNIVMRDPTLAGCSLAELLCDLGPV
jgi:hypothetical protein